MDTQRTPISKTVQDQVTAFATEVKKIAPDAKVILFGSQTAGTASPGSDIDICVVTRQFGNDYHGGTVTLLSLAHKFTIPMDVIPYTPGDLNNKYDPLAKEIRTQGTVVG